MDVPLEFIFSSCPGLDPDVSILVLVDVPLEFDEVDKIPDGDLSFNPCFSGCAS